MQRCAIVLSMAPHLLIADAQNATIEELKNVLTTRCARLKSDRANPTED
jgi:hypothetical protein